MADNIIKLRVDSQEYEGKIKRAAQGLQALGQNLRSAGKTFADADKEAVKFAQELGKMQTVSNTARGKISELSAAFVNLKSDYLKMTDAEKQSPMGQAMANSLEQLKARTLDAKRELESLNKELELTSTKASGGGSMNQLLGGVAGKFGMSASMFTGVGAAVAGVGAAYKAISDNISTAIGFEKSMSQLSSLTGMVGKDLEQLKEYAIELGSTSTLTASQVADAFRLIGSQQPQLLESGEALKEVTKYAITLSEAAGIDLVTAAQTLSTSINQMGGDSDNAARYVNVLAAASQKGSGDIAWLGEAITKSATAAKAVGTDYEELVGNLEQLAKAGFDASTAGTALRSIIMNLEKQANNDFKPSIVGLTQAFENLGKANLDLTGYQEIAGKMFATQAKVLADAAGEARNMTVAITGTNTATEQAATNTANLDGSLKSLSSAWEGLNLHINSSNGLLKDAVDWLKDVVVWADEAFTSIGKVTGNRAELNNEGGGGQTRVDRQIYTLGKIQSPQNRQATYTQQVENYWRYINEWNKKLKEAESRKDVFAWETIKKNNDISTAKANIAGAQSMLEEYQKRAKELLPKALKSATNNGSTKVTVDVEVDTEESKKGIKELQNEIKKLKKLRDDAAESGDMEMRDQYNAQIKDVQAQIKAMRGGGGSGSAHRKTTTTEQTEMQTLQKQIQELEQEYIKLGGITTEDADKRRGEINAEIAANETRINQIKLLGEQAHGRFLGGNVTTDNLGPERFAETPKPKDFNETMKGFTNMKQQVQMEMTAENVKVDEAALKTILKDSIQNGINGMDLQFNAISSQIAKGIDIPDTAWQNILDQYNKLREQMGQDPIIINFKTGKMEGVISDVDKLKKTISTTASVVGTIGQAFNAIEDPAARVAGLVAQAIATTALAYAKALETDWSSKTSIWGFIAAAAASTASMVTTIASIHQATGYAQGGIIKGNSYSGDNIYGGPDVMVNAGELVLTKAQQSTLASQLQNNGQTIRVVGKLHGKDLFICAENWSKSAGHGEFVTW